MDETQTIEFTKDDVGLILAGNEGWRTIAGMIRLAMSVGYNLTYSEANAVKAFESAYPRFEDSFGIIHETTEYILGEKGLANRCEKWLNKNKAPEGCLFHWYEGDFYLSEIPEEITESHS